MIFANVVLVIWHRCYNWWHRSIVHPYISDTLLCYQSM